MQDRSIEGNDGHMKQPGRQLYLGTPLVYLQSYITYETLYARPVLTSCNAQRA